MPESTMLLISDDEGLIDSVNEVARSIEGLSLKIATSVDGAFAFGPWDSVALVLIQVREWGSIVEVTRLLRLISASRRPIATVVLGDREDTEREANLMRLGVADYLGGPVDPVRLAYLVEVLTLKARRAQVSVPSETPATLPATSSDPVIDDESLGVDRLMNQVRRVAPQAATILLTGETGTGKTRIARIIHDLSTRKDEPFVVVNCGSFGAGSIEREMFGYFRGAFPGADRDRVGKFAEVGRGTLFLDEIDALPAITQARLLRVIEDRTFEPIGSDESQPFRARLIAASSQPLEREVEEGRFRSDLYYRLNVIGFRLPTLRERRSAIPALVANFLHESVTRNSRSIESISAEALRALEQYNWPGNIRELRNLLERAMAVCSGQEIRVTDLPEAILAKIQQPRFELDLPSTAEAPELGRSTLAQIKREAEFVRITEALEKHSNNRLRAASELGISRMTLYKKLYKYGLMHHAASNGHGNS